MKQTHNKINHDSQTITLSICGQTVWICLKPKRARALIQGAAKI